jgi:hypothetical protein
LSAPRRRRLTPARVIALFVALVVALNLVALGLDALTGTPSGPTSSSYATAPSGLAAYAELLAAFGHPIARLRGSLANHRLDPSATIVLLDPNTVGTGQTARLRSFVERGGRLIAGGPGVVSWMARLAPPPRWLPTGSPVATPLAPTAETDGVDRVDAAGRGSWSEARGWLPVLAGGPSTLMVVATIGRGRVALLADSSVLQNAFLRLGDNAALGLALAGGSTRRVLFAEGVHGFGEATGVAALPERARWALAALLGAALVYVVARGRRLGPPELAERELPPPRRAYVDALAALLARTRRPAEAIASLQAAARARLARRAGLAGTPDESALRDAAARLGLRESGIRAIFEPARSDDDVMAVGRAFAELHQSIGAGP